MSSTSPITGLVTPDFSEVADQVTAGTYKARITGAKFGEWNTDRGTTKFVNWEMETFGEAEEKNNGRRIFHKTPINGKGAFRLQQFYKAAMKSDLAGAFDTEMLLGKELQVTVVDGTDKEGNATGYTDIKAVKPL